MLHKEALDFEYVAPDAAELQVNLTLHDLAPEGRRATPGAMVTYQVDDISPDMSFLEMLDVLNERLILRGRGADRVRPRLPRGHLRHVRR